MSADDEKDASTVVMQTLPPELMAAATEAAQQSDEQEAATESMAAVDPSQVQAAPDAGGAQALPRSRRRREKAQSGGFSETQWFMKGAEIDADLLETVDDEEYDRDQDISEAARDGFTLRKEEE